MTPETAEALEASYGNAQDSSANGSRADASATTPAAK